MRSAPRARSEAARTGNATSCITEVVSVFHVRRGIRNMVIPGALLRTIVVTKFTAPRIVLKPDGASPMTQRLPPRPGELTTLDGGA
jgi:hypothetical protein